MEFEPHEEENQELDTFKRDKIFDNTYDEAEIETGEISYKLESSAESKIFENIIDESIVFTKVDKIIKSSKFTKFINADDNGEFKKLNKNDINEIYAYLTTNLNDCAKIEIFSVMSNFFDINPDKFYESLSNKFKTDLISELKERGYIKNKSLF